MWHATVIPPRTHPIPSELGSETWLGPISTGLRDHLGTLGAVVFCWFGHCSVLLSLSMTGAGVGAAGLGSDQHLSLCLTDFFAGFDRQ
jgi:hypothetical protein